jgi:hypothetical protein
MCVCLDLPWLMTGSALSARTEKQECLGMGSRPIYRNRIGGERAYDGLSSIG